MPNANPQDKMIKIRGSHGLVHTFHKTVAVTAQDIQVIYHSGRADVYPLDKVRLACFEHWQVRAGLIGPVTATKLCAELRDANGEVVTLQPQKVKWWQVPRYVAQFYVDHFCHRTLKSGHCRTSETRPLR